METLGRTGMFGSWVRDLQTHSSLRFELSAGCSGLVDELKLQQRSLPPEVMRAERDTKPRFRV